PSPSPLRPRKWTRAKPTNRKTKSTTTAATVTRTVLSSTCCEDWSVELPGGIAGPTKIATSGATISEATIQTIRNFLPWPSLGGGPLAGSVDIQEPVHVADRLHRAAEAEDVAGRARDEALPAVVAGIAGAEAERDRAVREREPAGGVVALVLRVVGDGGDRD